jgi:hypothetical protein
MTGIGKVLVFLNLMAAAALLTWGLSAYRTSPNWVDVKTDTGTVEGEITLLKAEIKKYSDAVAGTHNSYAAKNANLAASEAARDFRSRRLGVWLGDAEKGQFFTLPVMPNDPAVLDTSDAAERGRRDIKRAILGPDNQPLKGLAALNTLFGNELRDREEILKGKVPVTPAQWMNPAALLQPARMADMGIEDLRRLHAWLSEQQKIADVAIDKQRAIQANLGNEAAYLNDERINWIARLQTVEQRNQQLKEKLKALGAQ